MNDDQKPVRTIAVQSDYGFYVESVESVPATSADREHQRIVREALERRLLLELAPAAFRVVMKVLKGSKTVTKLQFDGAKDVLSRAGFVPPKASEAPGNADKSMAEQSAAQLRRFINEAQGELANRSSPVIDGKTVAPERAPKDAAKLADILDC